jgi:hypothetical protein
VTARDEGAALSTLGAMRRRMEAAEAAADALADALTSCLVRLDDLNEGDGPTARYGRQALRRAGR